MNKTIAHSDITVVKVDENDNYLGRRIPILAIQYGLDHNIVLPNKRKYFDKIKENFCYAIIKNEVEVWRIENPYPAIGAVFLSKLERNGKVGTQMEDIVVRESFRNQGFGTTLIEFTAALALSKGHEFVAWECAENNPAQRLYNRLGATILKRFNPYRITKERLNLFLHNNHAECLPLKRQMFTISSRFSIFRATNYKINGFQGDESQGSYGIQIEDLNFESLDMVSIALANELKKLNQRRKINFIDLIICVESKAQMELIKYFNIIQNTYTGSLSRLWELKGEAFINAAIRGHRFMHNT